MDTLFRLIQGVDINVYYWLSRFHGNWFLDRLASHLESNNLLKSGVFLAMYWYFWFREERGQRERRSRILTILVGTLVGLVVTRMVATFAPFRVRPMYDTNLLQHPFSIPMSPNFVDWSAFPSDHAAYLASLGFGLIRLYRRLAIPVTLYLAVLICLPRMYLGIHFASDVLAGAGIGVVAVWAALQIEALRTSIARPLLAFMEAKPQVFYAAAFLILFEMAVIFWDIREPVRAVLHVGSSLPHHTTLGVGLALFGCLCGIGFVVRHRLVRRPSALVRGAAKPGSFHGAPSEKK
jgi:membrane-associated phospholipid phosphatase